MGEVTVALQLGDLLAGRGHGDIAAGVWDLVRRRAPMDAYVAAAERRLEGLRDTQRAAANQSAISGAYNAAEAVALSGVHTDREEWALAIRAAARAVELEESAYTLNTLAGAYRRAGRLDDAYAAYRRALQRDPVNGAARIGLGAVIADQGTDLAEALTLAQDASSAAPDDSYAHNLRGRVLLLLGRDDEAADAWMAALQCSSPRQSARQRLRELAAIYAARGDATGEQRIARFLQTA